MEPDLPLKIEFPGLAPIRSVDPKGTEQDFGEMHIPPDPGISTFPMTVEQRVAMTGLVAQQLKGASRSNGISFWRVWLSRFLFIVFLTPVLAFAVGTIGGLVVAAVKWLLDL